MSGRSMSHAHWWNHANGVNPSPLMRDWLTDTVSLTVKLVAHSRQFRVQQLSQRHEICLADEYHAVNLTRRGCVQQREVLLRCDEQPVVFAHTIVPLNATASDWPFFSALGERSLGTTLFGDQLVQRGRLQFARLQPHHPLARRAWSAIGREGERNAGPLYARRCLFRRKNGVLLVNEVFLPALIQLSLLHGSQGDTKENNLQSER